MYTVPRHHTTCLSVSCYNFPLAAFQASSQIHSPSPLASFLVLSPIHSVLHQSIEMYCVKL